ncbi:MAG: DUF3667 domain-containing protein [Opitutales bacterium]
MSRPATHDYANPASPRVCQNCSSPLTGPYCAQCGQHDVDYHRSFHHLFHDLLENLFHFEGKFFVTVAWLLAKPGRITLEFLAGRRASQLNPLRFYIFVSVLFFLGLTLLNHGHLIDIPRQQVNQLQSQLTGQAKELNGLTGDFTPEEKRELTRRIGEIAGQNEGKFDRDAIIASIREARKSVADARAASVPMGPRTRVHIDRSSDFGQSLSRKIRSGELTFSDIWEALEHRVPTLLFLGVPLFAFFLKLFYLRSGRFYIEHLIFSLHLHTWVFLVFMLGNGYLKLAALGPGWLGGWCGWAIALWVIWYVFRSFRVVYGQNRTLTAFKIMLLGFVHGFALVLLAVAVLSATVAWLAYE